MLPVSSSDHQAENEAVGLIAVAARLSSLHDEEFEQKELSSTNSSAVRAHAANIQRVADFKFRAEASNTSRDFGGGFQEHSSVVVTDS